MGTDLPRILRRIVNLMMCHLKWLYHFSSVHNIYEPYTAAAACRQAGSRARYFVFLMHFMGSNAFVRFGNEHAHPFDSCLTAKRHRRTIGLLETRVNLAHSSQKTHTHTFTSVRKRCWNLQRSAIDIPIEHEKPSIRGPTATSLCQCSLHTCSYFQQQ